MASTNSMKSAFPAWMGRWRTYRSVLLLAAALGLGVMAALGARQYIAEQVAIERQRLQPQHEEIDVVVAKRDLQRGDPVDGETMAIRRIPSIYASSATVRPEAFDAVIGARLAIPMRSGEPLMSPAVEGIDASSFSTKVKAGIRALTISVDEVSSISGMLQPGDRIDLQLTARPNPRPGQLAPPGDVTRMLMQDLLVLATGRQVRQSADDGTRGRSFTAITVEATPEQAQRLIVAQRGGRLTATLRNRDDRKLVDQRAIELNDLLGLPADTRGRASGPSAELFVGGMGPLRPLSLPRDGQDAGASGVAALLSQLGTAAQQAGAFGAPGSPAPTPSSTARRPDAARGGGAMVP